MLTDEEIRLEQEKYDWEEKRKKDLIDEDNYLYACEISGEEFNPDNL